MHYVMTLARWMASKAVKAEGKAMGRKPRDIDASEIAAYFTEHMEELIREAWDHPVPLSASRADAISSKSCDRRNQGEGSAGQFHCASRA
jgi:hypothetical protein